MIALLIPASKNVWEKPTTTVTKAIRPNADGSKNLARIDNCNNCNIETIAAEKVVHLNPEIDLFFKLTFSILNQLNIYIYATFNDYFNYLYKKNY